MRTSNYVTVMASASEWLADRLIRYRLGLMVFFLVVTAFLGYQASMQRMDPGFTKSIPLSHTYMKTYGEYTEAFGGANVIIVALMQKEGNIFNVDFFKALEKATQDVLFINGADRASVTSLFTPNVDFVLVDEEGFVGHRVVDADFRPTAENIEKVHDNLLVSQHVGRLVSHDFRGALIHARLVDKDPATGEVLDYTRVADTLEQIRGRYSNDQIDVHVIGFAKFIDDIIEGALGVIMFFVITLAVTFVLLIFFAGSWKLAVAAMVVSLVAVVWQLGLVHLLGYGIDPLSILVPFLVLAIGVSHAVQMTNAWRLGIVAGMDGPTAAKDAFNKLFIPGATALISDAVGFAVIMIIDIDIIRELGITASIGVAVMLLTNKFMLPIILSYLRFNEAEQARAKRSAEGADHPIWNYMARATRPGPAAAIIVVSLVLVGFGASRTSHLIVGDSEAGAPELWPAARYNQDIDVIVDNFSIGIDELTVIAESPRDGCTTYGVMETVARFVWVMRNVEGVQSVTTLSSVMKDRNVGNNEGHLKFYGLPRASYGLGSAMRNIELNQQLFNDSCEAMPVRIFLKDHKAQTLARVVKAVKEFKVPTEGDGAQVRLRLASGPAGVMAATNEAVRSSVLTMDVILFVAIFLCCFFTFFSWRAALCVMLPLLGVSIFANAVMVFLNIGLKVSTLPVLALGVGVGVDYGIYLAARAFFHMREGIDIETAFQKSYREVGTAVMFTAVTMSFGVALWYFSALKFQSDMGVLLAYMFFVNMLGAMVLMPAITRFLIGRGGAHSMPPARSAG